MNRTQQTDKQAAEEVAEAIINGNTTPRSKGWSEVTTLLDAEGRVWILWLHERGIAAAWLPEQRLEIYPVNRHYFQELVVRALVTKVVVRFPKAGVVWRHCLPNLPGDEER